MYLMHSTSFFSMLFKKKSSLGLTLFLVLDLSIKSPSVSPPISSAFAPYPLLRWYLQSNEIFVKFGHEMLKLSI
jgi:hypothetical protein